MQLQLAVVVEGVGAFYAEVAGIIALAVGRYAAEAYAAVHYLGVPQEVVEALEAAVQMVVAVVALQLQRLAVEREAALADAVAVAAYQRAQIAAGMLVGMHVVAAQQHVGELAGVVGHAQLDYRRAVIDYGYICALGVGYAVEGYFLAALQSAELSGGNCHVVHPPVKISPHV